MYLTMPASHPDQPPTFLEEMVFDHAELSDRLDQDQDLLREVLSAFLIDLPEISANFSDALDSGDMEMIRAVAHKVKGAVANVSFKQLGELTRQIEYAARASDVARVYELGQYLAQAVKDASAQIHHHLGPDANS
ncbi:MAG: Hpt domain-containing protein [Gammaproteobacteria bacterium]|nr:Hpt domain-containing protein [Gammaproteobacteria bacterium]